MTVTVVAGIFEDVVVDVETAVTGCETSLRLPRTLRNLLFSLLLTSVGTFLLSGVVSSNARRTLFRTVKFFKNDFGTVAGVLLVALKESLAP